MTTPITNKPILSTLPARAIARLKGVTSIESFAFGKETFKPAMIELFKRQGIEISDIQFDPPAKARLMGMMNPSFKEMFDQGKTAAEIFTYLELSLFSSAVETGASTLYILGDKDNNRTINAAKRTPINKPTASEAPSPPATETNPLLTIEEKAAGLIFLLREKVLGQFIVAKPGQQLPALSKIRSAGKTDPVLSGKMKFISEEYFDIRLTELFTDDIGQSYLAAERPSYPDKVEETKGNLAVDGHVVVFEMQNVNEARLYLLRDPGNIAKLVSAADSSTAPSSSPREDETPKLDMIAFSETQRRINQLKDLGVPFPKDDDKLNELLYQNISRVETLASRIGKERFKLMLYLMFYDSSKQPKVSPTLKPEIATLLDRYGLEPFLTFLLPYSTFYNFSDFQKAARIIDENLPKVIDLIKTANDLSLFLSLAMNGIVPSPNLFTKARRLTLPGEFLTPALIKNLKNIERKELRSSLASKLELPKMIELSDKVNIMKEVVTTELFKQVMQGYRPKGDGESLASILKRNKDNGMTYLYVDVKEVKIFAERLSKLTGRSFRIPTRDEIAKAERELGPQVPDPWAGGAIGRAKQIRIVLVEDLPINREANK